MSDEPIQLDTIVVQSREVQLRKVPGGPDRMFVQADGTGNVLVDFADGNNPWGDIRDLNEAQYEELRKEAFRKELADLEDIPTYAELYPPPGRGGGGASTTPNGNTQGRVNGEAPATGKSADDSNAEVESETPAEDDTGDKILDGLQLGLDVVGLIPVVGEIADLANAGISLARGDYAGAALSVLSAIPFAGWLGTAGKVGRHGAKAAAEASTKAAKEAAERAAKEAADKAAKEAAQKKAKEEAARKKASGAKANAKKLPKKKPECFDPRQSDAYKKMSEAEKKKYLKEYARQLKRQEDAINNMSAKEFSDARAMFEKTKKANGGSGRNPLADKAQEQYRKKREKDIERSIFESTRRNSPDTAPNVADAAAKSRSKEIMEGLAALHEPDMVAGGWHSPKPTGLGDTGVNSAIGGSWRHKGRVPMLEDAAKDAVARGNGADIMNVELTICPPGKKGKK
ncbi:polymorphic toxin type 15 domain-containing protein [Pseudomonas aeruginosa]|uniref:polymorphic toxin type 15 domain-containing protein n=1 Tax=Pseudomonas aeruginosa TaxID=287 RepID=UPI00214976F7|nr:polymorphic toxin type 15 domain-containing protein [Pseudomonas aeruginosa]MCQ9863048.1 polymorphic toxin type 15 domain-containing protein [Pseudomonas aeruginosa]MCS8056769.1 polymorphic toxin type 15 domain-containing protein [Pseudomonas aeruginosa]MCT0838728.1 polymorphic toxin type 15 domain-containing protein [Pseudomonas aeruginosa]